MQERDRDKRKFRCCFLLSSARADCACDTSLCVHIYTSARARIFMGLQKEVRTYTQHRNLSSVLCCVCRRNACVNCFERDVVAARVLLLIVCFVYTRG